MTTGGMHGICALPFHHDNEVCEHILHEEDIRNVLIAKIPDIEVGYNTIEIDAASLTKAASCSY